MGTFLRHSVVPFPDFCLTHSVGLEVVGKLCMTTDERITSINVAVYKQFTCIGDSDFE